MPHFFKNFSKWYTSFVYSCLSKLWTRTTAIFDIISANEKLVNTIINSTYSLDTFVLGVTSP